MSVRISMIVKDKVKTFGILSALRCLRNKLKMLSSARAFNWLVGVCGTQRRKLFHSRLPKHEFPWSPFMGYLDLFSSEGIQFDVILNVNFGKHIVEYLLYTYTNKKLILYEVICFQLHLCKAPVFMMISVHQTYIISIRCDD